MLEVKHGIQIPQILLTKFSVFMVADNVQAIFDLWVIGDEFIREAFSTFESIKLQAKWGKMHQQQPEREEL